MILDRTPLTLGEVREILENLEDSEKKKEMEVYLKKFQKIDVEKTKKMKEDLEALDLMKMKREHIVKIVDLMPKDMSDINKIFVDVSLNEDEANKILEVVKNNK